MSAANNAVGWWGHANEKAARVKDGRLSKLAQNASHDDDYAAKTHEITAGLAYFVRLVYIGSELSQFQTHFPVTLLSSQHQGRVAILFQRRE